MQTMESAGEHQRPERLSLEKQVDGFLASTIKRGKAIARSYHETPEAAFEAGNEFLADRQKSAAELSGLAQLTFRVSGSGVKVANISMSHDGEGRLDVDFHAENPVGDLGLFEERYGHYMGIVIIPTEREDGKHSTMPYLVMQDKQRRVVEVNAQYGFPLTRLTVDSHMLVACDGSASIDIPVLTQFRARNDAIGRLAIASGNSDTHEIMKKVHRINSALHNENPYGYVPLQHVEDLKALGEIASTDGSKREEIIEVLVGMLGNGRLVSIAGEVSFAPGRALESHEVNGAVIDILPSHPNDERPDPTLVLSCPEADGGETLCYVPVSRVRDFRF